jgi:hypothetical protein
MNEKEEAAYMLGRKAVLREQLSAAMKGLNAEDLTNEYLIQERVDAIAALRSVCNEHGDNDWEDDLYLSDIISKHLADHLDS